MKFNSTSDGQGLIQECEFLTTLGKAQISGDADRLKDFTRLMNARYHQVITMILASQDEWDFDDSNHTDFPILTTDLVADQPDYALAVAEKILKIKRVEISFDGSNWYRCNPIDINEISDPTDTTTIANRFSQTEPYYDILYGSIFLYPIPTANSTGGLKLWVTREIDEFTTSDTTQEPGIDEPFHRMLAIGASLDWAITKGLSCKTDLQNLWIEYEMRLRNFYGKKQKDRIMILKASYTNYN